MDPCCIAGPVCAFLFPLSACFIAWMNMRARTHEADALVSVAQIEASATKKREHAGSRVMPAWVVLILGLGCSCGLMKLNHQRHAQQDALAKSTERCTPDNCHPPKKCNGNVCTTHAVTDGIVPPAPPKKPASPVLFDELAVLPKIPDNPNRPPDGLN